MVDARWMAEVVNSALPDASVHATDLNGGGDHWHVVVVSPAFVGLRSLQRQKQILPAFTPHIQSGVVHALDLKCLTPTELENNHGGVLPAPFIPHQAGQGSHPGAW